MYSHIESTNRAVLDLEGSHPAKRFLVAFMACRMNCSERELQIADQTPIDQTWTSATDGRLWTFSGFIYSYLCFDIELDGFLQSVPSFTASEIDAIRELPRLKTMMNECTEAARQSGNTDIVDLTDQVLELFGLWDEYLRYRSEMILSVDRRSST